MYASPTTATCHQGITYSVTILDDHDGTTSYSSRIAGESTSHESMTVGIDYELFRSHCFSDSLAKSVIAPYWFTPTGNFGNNWVIVVHPILHCGEKEAPKEISKPDSLALIQDMKAKQTLPSPSRFCKWLCELPFFEGAGLREHYNLQRAISASREINFPWIWTSWAVSLIYPWTTIVQI